MIDDGRPLFVQIAEQIEGSIIDGSLAEEAQVPSTNELAAFHRINPATAAKGVNQLVADGILYKRRGIGMFVHRGADAAARTPPRPVRPPVHRSLAGRGAQARDGGGHKEDDRRLGRRPMSIVELDDVTKRFRDVTALDE